MSVEAKRSASTLGMKLASMNLPEIAGAHG
jgi:hypothetical protein